MFFSLRSAKAATGPHKTSTARPRAAVESQPGPARGKLGRLLLLDVLPDRLPRVETAVRGPALDCNQNVEPESELKTRPLAARGANCRRHKQ